MIIMIETLCYYPSNAFSLACRPTFPRSLAIVNSTSGSSLSSLSCRPRRLGLTPASRCLGLTPASIKWSTMAVMRPEIISKACQGWKRVPFSSSSYSEERSALSFLALKAENVPGLYTGEGSGTAVDPGRARFATGSERKNWLYLSPGRNSGEGAIVGVVVSAQGRRTWQGSVRRNALYCSSSLSSFSTLDAAVFASKELEASAEVADSGLLSGSTWAALSSDAAFSSSAAFSFSSWCWLCGHDSGISFLERCANTCRKNEKNRVLRYLRKMFL